MPVIVLSVTVTYASPPDLGSQTRDPMSHTPPTLVLLPALGGMQRAEGPASVGERGGAGHGW
jgi:hypothetical protein